MIKNKSANTKGIILAAGRASRLFPITYAVNKQLLHIYDKPMIYYPLSVLMLSGINEILIITKKEDLSNFKSLLGNGNHLGIKLSYQIQKKPKGIAEAFIIGEKFISNSNCVLILGDNIFYGQGFSNKLFSAKSKKEGATIFSYPVDDPERYGVVELDKNKFAKKIVEKPVGQKIVYEKVEIPKEVIRKELVYVPLPTDDTEVLKKGPFSVPEDKTKK